MNPVSQITQTPAGDPVCLLLNVLEHLMEKVLFSPALFVKI